MQGIIGILVFGLIAIAIIVLVIINFTYKGVRQLREAMEERMERNQKIKEQRDKNPFGDDYFRSSGTTKQKSQKQSRQGASQSSGPRQSQTSAGEQPKEDTARRTTTTSSGVTIIDDRGADKKIFDHDDGEYVEFEEV